MFKHSYTIPFAASISRALCTQIIHHASAEKYKTNEKLTNLQKGSAWESYLNVLPACGRGVISPRDFMIRSYHDYQRWGREKPSFFSAKSFSSCNRTFIDEMTCSKKYRKDSEQN